MVKGYSIKRALKIGMKLPYIEILDVIGKDDKIQNITKLVETTETLKLENLSFVISDNVACKQLHLTNCNCSLENIYNFCTNVQNISFINCNFLETNFEYLAKFVKIGCVISFKNLKLDDELIECAKTFGFLGSSKLLYLGKQ